MIGDNEVTSPQALPNDCDSQELNNGRLAMLAFSGHGLKLKSWKMIGKEGSCLVPSHLQPSSLFGKD